MNKKKLTPIIIASAFFVFSCHPIPKQERNANAEVAGLAGHVSSLNQTGLRPVNNKKRLCCVPIPSRFRKSALLSRIEKR